MTPAQQALADLEAADRGVTVRRVRFWLVAVAIVAFYLVAGHLAQIDPGRLATGLPKIWRWIAQAWPPAIEEMPLFLQRTAETVAMAAIGTTLATVLAIPMSVLASRNITPVQSLYYPARWFLNGLRGIDSFIFALLFVAAVGLGPFAGVLGIALHTWGSAAKFFADHIENANLGPFDADRGRSAYHHRVRAGARRIASTALDNTVLVGIQCARVHRARRCRRWRHWSGTEEQHGSPRLPALIHDHRRDPCSCYGAGPVFRLAEPPAGLAMSARLRAAPASPSESATPRLVVGELTKT